MNFVYSTLAADTTYASYERGGGDLPIRTVCVLIRGGTGVADKNLVTPMGVVTSVTDEELEHLNKNSVFQLHMKNGFIKVTSRKTDVEKVVVGMKDEDESAPLTEADFAVPNEPNPVVVKGGSKSKSK